ncbi:MAG TPA: hypothetical protein DCX22_03360 [Dehalococcoidia bacterium]|nr:hypothetical protein [Dehalococcoidia bacterium]
MKIVLQPVGDAGRDTINELQRRLAKAFVCPMELVAPVIEIEKAFDESRNQYKASVLLAMLAAKGNTSERKVLGVADIDLYDDGLQYVFGEAEESCGVALISLIRLRQEFYALPSDEALFLDRATKESIHELGHTFGLRHCSDSTCVMYFSQCLADTDWKHAEFCSQCRPKLIL